MPLAPPLFWGHTSPLTAVPRHRTLGGAVAPLTRAGGARQAETRPPNRAWRGGPAPPAERALSCPPLSPTFSLPGVQTRSRPHPHPRPPLPVSLSLSLPVLGFPTLQAKVGPEAQGLAGCWSGWGRVVPSLCSPSRPQPFQDPKGLYRATAATTLSNPPAGPARPEPKGGQGCRGSLLRKRGQSR